MDMLSQIGGFLESQLNQAMALMAQPWTFYQFGIILGCYLLAVLIARRVTPRLEAWARTIKANPGSLRLIIAFMRRLKWLFFVILLAIARLVIESFTWDSRAYVVSLVLTLATAWLLISVASRIIHNRTVAQLIAFTVWAFVAVRLMGLEHDTVAFLDGMAFQFGAMHISVYVVLKAIIIVSALLWLAVFIGRFLENRIGRMEDLSPSLRVLLGKIVKISLLIATVAVALNATGIDLTTFAVFSGAIGVGIGFGLQKVVSNFISGIIILVDKSIKPGDTIELGDTFGWIRELRARFVSVITRDGREYLIPNEDFITQQVVNWSFSDQFVRIDIEFGVAYNSDPHEVSRIAIETAKSVKRVNAYRDPVCWLVAFGSSSLDFKLRIWISDPQNGLTNVRGQVMLALWDAFKEAGINIPFPHREVIFHDAPLNVRMAKGEGADEKTPAPDTKPADTDGPNGEDPENQEKDRT